MAKSKSTTKSGRAVISHGPKHIALRFGKCPQINNSNYEVHHQDEPTADDPVRQHHKLATGKKEGR